MIATQEQHAVAVVAALNTAGAYAYDLDDLPAARPAFYTEVTVSRRYGGTERYSGERNTTDLYRITTRAVARTVSNARLLRAKASALEGTTITVNSVVSTPIDFETEDPIGEDDGWFSGLQTWVYVL